MTAVNYDWDELEDNIVEENDDAKVPLAEYTAEPRLSGDIVSQSVSGQTSYFHYDGQGSTLAVTDATGLATDTRSYTQYGDIVEKTGNTHFPFQYKGRRGNYSSQEEIVTRDNIYSSALGRFMALKQRGAGSRLYNTYLGFVAGDDVPPEVRMPECSAEETKCIRDAMKLATDTITAKANECFANVQFCPNGKRSACTPFVLAECLIAVLKNTKYSCAQRGIGGCHAADPLLGNLAHTNSLCMILKGLGARSIAIPGVFACDKCKFPLSYANDCGACPDWILAATLTYLCQDKSPDRKSIASYCKMEGDKKKLAAILVHEAAHSCVGGHDTTGKVKPDDPASCDECGRNDSYDIEQGFKKCAGIAM